MFKNLKKQAFRLLFFFQIDMINLGYCSFDAYILTINRLFLPQYIQNLLTSLAANKGRLDDINTLANDIIGSGSSQKDQVKKRQKDINDR